MQTALSQEPVGREFTPKVDGLRRGLCQLRMRIAPLGLRAGGSRKVGVADGIVISTG